MRPFTSRATVSCSARTRNGATRSGCREWGAWTANSRPISVSRSILDLCLNCRTMRRQRFSATTSTPTRLIWFSPRLRRVATTTVAIVAIADSLPMFIVGLTMSAFGSSITGPAPAAFVADLVSEDQRGAAMGLYRTFGDIGVVVSPVLSGLLADAVSISFAIGVNAVFMGIAAAAFMAFAGSSSPAVEN